LFGGIEMSERTIICINGNKYFIRGKIRLVIVFSILTLIILNIFDVNVYGYKKNLETRTIIMKGDTLWNIAKKYSKNNDVREYIEKIKEKNDLEDSTIFEGEEIIIPF
jgi:hypothetical protein